MAKSNSMLHVAQEHSSKSDKIRALARAGYARADIARFMGIRYQFVRNVLENDKLRPRPDVSPATTRPSPTPASGGGQAHPAEPSRIGDIVRLTLDADGAVRLPQHVIDALGAREGGVIVSRLREGRLELLSAREALRQAREGISPWREGEPRWSDLLIEDRRREAANG